MRGSELAAFVSDDRKRPDIRKALENTLRINGADQDDAAQLLSQADEVLDHVLASASKPAAGWAGALTTWEILKAVGRPIDSNLFNPISWDGVRQMSDALLAHGAPQGLLDGAQISGPFDVGAEDALFFGGWDRATSEAMSRAATAGLRPYERSPLAHLRWWIDKALELDLTLWAMIA